MAALGVGAHAALGPVPGPPVGAVAERPKPGPAAPAEGDRSAAGVDLAPVLVEEDERSAHDKWAVALRHDLRTRVARLHAAPSLSVRSAAQATSAASPRSAAISRCRRGEGRTSVSRPRSTARSSAGPPAKAPTRERSS